MSPLDPGAETLPLSFAQERLWLLDRMQPGSALYNVPCALRLQGALDADALERALGEIVRRHEALRTTFAEADGAPVQVIAPFTGFTLPAEDVGAHHVPRLAAEDAARPFDLTKGPLFRARLLRVASEDHVLLMCIHHVVSDGWSLGVLFHELSALYGAFRDGGESPLPELPIQYADFAIWQREQVAGDALERHLAYWRERLAGAPALLELPFDHPRPAVRTYGGARERMELPRELLERLRVLARREGATPYMVLLAAWQALLAKYAGSTDVVVGSPAAGRESWQVQGLIGFFVNTLVLRTDLSRDPSFREVLRRAREATLGAYEHQDLPFEKLVAELCPERSTSHSPLFQVMFALDDAEGARVQLPGLRAERLHADLPTTKFDLSLAFAADAEGFRAELSYATGLFERETAARMLEHLRRVLEQVAARPEARLSELVLMSEAERRRVLVEWNRTAAVYPADGCIHHLFAEQAARTPAAIAVVSERASLGYGELDERANRLAGYLAERGVGPEVRVGLCLERGVEMVVATLAVLRAGGAYVPLDAGYPAERLAFMLADARTAVLVTRERLLEELPVPRGTAVVCVDRDAAEIAATAARPPADVTARNLAYVMYTSGSTGTPKGVGVEHRCVVRLVRGANYADLGPNEVILQAAPVSFDAATLEIWGALLNGGRLVLAPGASLDELGRAIRDHGVTTLWLTAGLFQVMVDERLDDFGRVRQLLAGGDVLPAAQVKKIQQRFPALRLINGYGPTENTTFTCCHTVPAGWSGASVPIGTPISNTRVYVLDAALGPVPVGLPGELYAGGHGVARGYVGSPRATAERFLPDPFGEPGARMYRTGDRVRWTAEGAVEYLGRLDTQVKVRGFRVEPGEVEAALGRHPRVSACAVVARGDAAGEKRLVAYVVGDAEADELRSALRTSLPEYMVPDAFVFLDALPLGANGKVDRRALPAPEQASGETYAAPRTPVEERLAAIWGEVLGHERVGIHDDFFALGGHSLLAARVVSRVREALGAEVGMVAIFEHPTVAALAGVLSEPAARPITIDTVAASPHLLMARVDDLSDEELDALLAAES